MQVVSINGSERKQVGSTHAAQVRRNGEVPCVLYGKEGNYSFSAKPLEIRHIIFTPEFKLAEINLEGKLFKAIVKEIQYHPITDAVSHVDFLQLIPKHPVRVEVPIKLVGAPVGVKSGGKLLQKVRTVKIKCTPENLIDEMQIDVNSLDLGGTMRIKDIQPIAGVEIINTPSIPVVSIQVTRALKQEATAAAAPAKKEVKK